MGDTHGAQLWEGMVSSPFSGGTQSPNAHVVPNQEALQTPSFWVCGGSITRPN